MAYIGGSVKHLNIGGKDFPATPDSDVSLRLHGYTPSVESNGDGSIRKLLLRRPWQITGGQYACDVANGDLEYLQDSANRSTMESITITLVDDTRYAGQGTVAIDPEFSTQSGSVSIDVSGTLELTPL